MINNHNNNHSNNHNHNNNLAVIKNQIKTLVKTNARTLIHYLLSSFVAKRMKCNTFNKLSLSWKEFESHKEQILSQILVTLSLNRTY